MLFLRAIMILAICAAGTSSSSLECDVESFGSFGSPWPSEFDTSPSDIPLNEPPSGKESYSQPSRTVVLYSVAGGLVNQLYGHMAALLLACEMGAELILHPALSRDTFGRSMPDAKWQGLPLASILDVAHLTAFWSKRGIILHQHPTLFPLPCFREATADTHLGNIDLRLVVRYSLMGNFHASLKSTALEARQLVARHARQLRAMNPMPRFQYIVLDLGHILYPFNNSRSMMEASIVAKSFRFAADMLSIANRVIANLKAHGGETYHGIHLRLEGDAQAAWIGSQSQLEAAKAFYIQAMQELGFNRTSNVYVASGLLGKDVDHEVFNEFEEAIITRELAQNVYHKEQFISAYELDSLQSEQLALIDFIVLTHADSFVGWYESTFSLHVREYRAMHGLHARNTTVAVHADASYSMGFPEGYPLFDLFPKPLS